MELAQSISLVLELVQNSLSNQVRVELDAAVNLRYLKVIISGVATGLNFGSAVQWLRLP